MNPFEDALVDQFGHPLVSVGATAPVKTRYGLVIGQASIAVRPGPGVDEEWETWLLCLTPAGARWERGAFIGVTATEAFPQDGVSAATL